MVASAAGADSSQRELTSLATKWNISEPEFEYASLSFTLDFKVTDYIVMGQNMVRWTIYDENCKLDESTPGYVDNSVMFNVYGGETITFPAGTEYLELISKCFDTFY